MQSVAICMVIQTIRNVYYLLTVQCLKIIILVSRKDNGTKSTLWLVNSRQMLVPLAYKISLFFFFFRPKWNEFHCYESKHPEYPTAKGKWTTNQPHTKKTHSFWVGGMTTWHLNNCCSEGIALPNFYQKS